MLGSQSMYVELSTGSLMPMVGLGTYLIKDRNILWKVLDEALEIGYRLIDTAFAYENEMEIGFALKQLLPRHNLRREDIFITSKLPPEGQGDVAINFLHESLKNLQCGYLDLYLIHWPASSDYDPRDPVNAFLRERSWVKMVEAKQAGLVKSLGVSNYCIRQLAGLLQNCYGEKPSVIQNEWHPHWHEGNLKEFCAKHKIQLQAYFSFGGTQQKLLLRDATIKIIAEKIGKSPAQVLLQWSLQQGVAVIPKSTSKNHLKNNRELNFTIPPQYMMQLSSLPQTRYGGDPNTVY